MFFMIVTVFGGITEVDESTPLNKFLTVIQKLVLSPKHLRAQKVKLIFEKRNERLSFGWL